MHARIPSRRRPALRRLPLALAAASLFGAALPLGAGPLPGGLQVVRGQASVVTHGQHMTVTNSAGAILNWQQFSIGQGQSVYFQQPSSLSSVLNRVTGRDPSSILGTLGSNGRVWLLNPQGVLFGRDARIDVAGLVASTLNITDADWAAGRYRLFDEGAGGPLLNQGTLRSAQGGQILLVGGSAGVRNEGLIHAPGGQVMLAAGQSVELADTTLPHLAVRIAAPAGEALNLGRLVADGGRVDLMAAMVNQSGIVRADALGDGPGGQVRLDATEQLTLGEGSQTSATGSSGGGLVLQGRHIALLEGSVLDASGAAGGGQVFVGGGERGQDTRLRNAEALWMAPGARILADAGDTGDGGRIVLWSDRATRAYGHFSARGGLLGGDGGFVETSGGWLDARPASVSTAAPRGRAGRWLLDPWDITISDELGDANITGGPDFASTDTGAVLSTQTIEAALEAGNNVTITTTQDACCDQGDIRMINATIDVAPAAPVSLSMLAERNIVLDFATIRSTGRPLSLSLTSANSGQGAVTINGSSLITAGGDIAVGGHANLCNFRLCAGEFTGGALATDFTGLGHGITIASSLLDATGGRISLRGFSEVSVAETAGVLISDGSTLRARDMDIVGVVVSDGTQQRTGVKIGGGLLAATNSIDIQGYAFASNYSFDGSVVGVDILGEVRVDGEGATGAGDSLLSVYGYSEDNVGYGGYGGYGFGAAPRYGLGIRGGTGRVAGTGGVDIRLEGEVFDSSGNFGLLAEGTGAAYIDASQARNLDLVSGGPMSLKGDIRLSELGGAFSATVAGFEDLSITGATLTGDPSSVNLSGYSLVIGTESDPARLVFGDATQVHIDASFFLFGTETIALPNRLGADQPMANPRRMRPLDVLFDLPPASTLLAAGGPITVQADAVSIGAGATIHSPHAGLAISIVGSQVNGTSVYTFQNAGGAEALSAPNGWWEVWSYGPEGNGSFAPGGLVPAYRQYGATYGVATPFFGGFNAFLFDTTADLTLVGPLPAPPFSKVYDGNTVLPPAAGTYTYAGLAGNDVLVGFAGYDDKNVGTGKNIVLQPGASATGVNGPDGAPVFGFSVDNSAGIGLGTITPATIDLTGALVIDRVYDGGVNATVLQWNFSGFVPGDDLGVVGSATFSDKNVGVAKPVSLVVTDKTGVDAGNYVFGTTLTGTATASITPALLTLVSASVPDKVYDGSLLATVDSLTVGGVVPGDTLAFSASAAFGDKGVGAGKAVTVSLDAFSGTEQGNYALGFPTTLATSAAITPATIDLVAATVANKVYDTTVAAAVTGFALAGVVVGDDVVPGGSGTFADRHVGKAKTVTVSLAGIGGTDASNYVLGSTTALASADITPAPVGLAGGSAASKVYDGGTVAAVTGLTLSGVLGSDAVTGSGSGAFSDRNVGVGKTVALTLSALGGADGGNYTIVQPSATTTADINPATLNLAGGSAADKVYDATTAATVTGLTLSGVLGSDAVTGTGSGSFADKNVGNGKTVTLALGGLVGADAGNYVIGTASASTTASITAATLNLAGGSAADKVYDATTAATVTGLTLSGVLGGDAVTGTGSGSFADKNVGNGKTVTLSLAGLAGADAGNYVIGTSSASTTASITAATLNLAGGSAADKVYDATTAATVTGLTLSGVLGGDSVSGTGSGNFVDKNAGTGKTVQLTLSGLAGADAGNYVIGTHSASTSAAITRATLNLAGGSASDKVYDATTVATVTGLTLSGVLGGDTVSGTVSGSFADNNVGNGKTVTLALGGLAGADAGNYVIGTSSASTTASITAATLNLAGGSAADKVYDASTAATVTGLTLSGVLGGDTVSGTGSGSFADKNVGNGKTVTLALGGLAGADAGNYVIGTSSASTTASITAATLNLAGGSAADKVYDASTAATVTGLTLSGVLGGDAVTGTGSGSFADKNVGNGKTVTLALGGLVGADAGNYVIGTASASTTASITPATIGLTGGTAADKVYDASTAATVTGLALSGVLGGDAVTGTGSGSFADKNVGNGKTVTLALGGLVGADAGNYVIGTSSASTTASITPATLNLAGGSVADKVYDATTAASVTGLTLSGVLGGDTVSGTGSGSFADKNVGVGKPVALTLGSLSGTDAGNYVIGTASASTTASITAATLNLAGGSAADKVYDATTVATVTGLTLSGVLGGDTVSGTGTGSFADKNVGVGKAVTLNLTGLSGADAGNYALGTVTALASADITPATVSLAGGSAANKVYDTTTTATVTGLALSGVLGGDTVAGTGSGRFADKNVGVGKAVTLTLTDLTGTDAGNYAIGGATASTAATITPATVNLSGGLAADKVYDGNTIAGITTLVLTGVLGNDVVAGSGSGSFADKNAGTGKTVALTLSGLTGADAGNYAIGTAVGATTASITRATIDLDGALVADKTYDRGTGATVANVALAGVVAGDSVTGSATGSFLDRNAGTGKPVQVTLTALAGADAGNYVIGQPGGSATASILPAPVTLVGGSAAGKTYDGTADTTASALALGGVIAGDTVTGSGSARFADRNAGTGKAVTLTLLGLGGADAGNYTLGNLLTATTTADIAPALLSYVATPASITTNDTLPSFTGTVTGFVGGDLLATATTGTALFSSGLQATPAAGSYAINGSGLSATNYSFTQAAGNASALTVVAAPAPPPPPPVSGEEAAGVVTPTERVAGTRPPRDLLPQPFVTMPEIGRLLDLMQGLEPGRTDLFGALDISGLGPDRMAAVLAARDEYKKALFAEALTRLEQDPSIADAPGCATAQQAASGQCLMVTPLDRDSVISNARVVERQPITPPPTPAPAPPPPAPQGAVPPPAPATPPAALAARPPVPVVVPAFPDRRAVRQAVLPQIQRKIAVVVGIDEYADPRIPRLANAVRDAQAVARALEASLGYETVVLQNPTKAAMFRVFNRLAAESGPNDSVVLYYAGHGELVEKTGLGYWQPSDADAQRPETWISNADINRVLRGIGASQVALVSDSCFSGSLVGESRIRGVNPNQDPSQLLSRRAAVVMSSGGNEPVADSGRNGHSPFAFSLMQSLERVPAWRPGSNVFEQVRFQVARLLPQRPQYGASTVGGHEPGADYLFENRQIEGVTR